MSFVGSLGSGASATTNAPLLTVTKTRLLAGTSMFPVIFPSVVIIDKPTVFTKPVLFVR